jgi:hypothetical protein
LGLEASNKMRRLTFLTLLTIILSCQSGHENRKYSRHLTLINNIGTLTINLTTDFDTLHTWKRSSDINCGVKQYYRIQSSKYPMTEERGEYSNSPDTMYGITITHTYFPECQSNIEFNPDKELKLIKQKNIENNRHIKFKVLEQVNINGLKFIVCGTIGKPFNNIVEQNFSALTKFRSTNIDINFLKSSSYLTDTTFIRDCYEMLKTIKIE